VAEAVNIAASEWLPFAKQAMEDYAQDGFYKKSSFPIEWLIIENIRMLEDLDFSDLTKIKVKPKGHRKGLIYFSS